MTLSPLSRFRTAAFAFATRAWSSKATCGSNPELRAAVPCPFVEASIFSNPREDQVTHPVTRSVMVVVSGEACSMASAKARVVAS